MIPSDNRFRKAKRKSCRFHVIKAKNIFLVLLALIILLFFSAVNIYNAVIKPVIVTVSEHKAKNLSTQAISESVIKILREADISYDDIVETKTDSNGRVTSLSVKLSEINKLKSLISIEINKNINSREKVKIHIPFGNLTGIGIFSGLGPRIPISLVPSGNTVVDFENTFEDEGINQTRHTVSLKIVSKVSMLLPGMLTASSETVSFVPIAESIVVGDTPESFTDLTTVSEELRNDLLNLH